MDLCQIHSNMKLLLHVCELKVENRRKLFFPPSVSNFLLMDYLFASLNNGRYGFYEVSVGG